MTIFREKFLKIWDFHANFQNESKRTQINGPSTGDFGESRSRWGWSSPRESTNFPPTTGAPANSGTNYGYRGGTFFTLKFSFFSSFFWPPRKMGLLPKQPDKVNWVELEREAISKGHFDSSCPICLTRHGQKRRKSVVTSCGHVFHMSCLRATRINQASPKCPLCRSEYKSHVAVEGTVSETHFSILNFLGQPRKASDMLEKLLLQQSKREYADG